MSLNECIADLFYRLISVFISDEQFAFSLPFLFVCLFVCLIKCLFVGLFVFFFVCLLVYFLFACFVWWVICLFVSLLNCLFICFSVFALFFARFFFHFLAKAEDCLSLQCLFSLKNFLLSLIFLCNLKATDALSSKLKKYFTCDVFRVFVDVWLWYYSEISNLGYRYFAYRCANLTLCF